MDRPDPPKRPMSGFFRYMKDVEPDLKKEFPDLKRPQLVSKMSSSWKTITEEQKKKYSEEYAAERLVYDKIY